MESQEFSNVGSTSSEEMAGDEKTGIEYSPSVRTLQSNFATGATVSSMDLIRELAGMHREYAGGKFEKLAYETEIYSDISFSVKPVEEWFQQVEERLNPEQVPELHGRLFALSLCELDDLLKEVFEQSGIYKSLLSELKEDFSSLLKDHTKASADPAKLHLDSDSRVDHLGRDGFVEALATWLNRFWRRSNPNVSESKSGISGGNSFMVHLHGPWGSGKSTLLNLLEQKLTGSGESENNRKEKTKGENRDPELEWMVIHFNAWQHSHVKPAWWPLLHRLYSESQRNLWKSRKFGRFVSVWLYDFYWKLISGNKSTGYWFALFVVLFILVSWNDGSEFTESYIQLATLAATVVTGGSYFFRSLIWGSANSAQDYLRLNQDPLEKIKTYFQKIVVRIDQPVMIYIDDLDRCPASYVVDLLESLQTLFNDSKVFYVLAADRRWLYGSFEERYREFQRHIEEPGKQIGYLFLDKLFQLSISVPQVSAETRENYLNFLYLGENHEGLDIEEVRRQAREEFQQVTSESELIGKAGRESGESGIDQIRREEAVRASANVMIETSTEYFLKQFAHLLEPNPRSIKRLVNNYGIYRAIVMLSDVRVIDSDEKRKKFALWNILAMRWPLLAEYMEEERRQIPVIVGESADQVELQEIKELTAMREVQDVLKGKGIGTSLDAEYIKQILRLQAAPA